MLMDQTTEGRQVSNYPVLNSRTFEPDTHQQQATAPHSVCECINALTAPVLVAYGKARKRRQRIARRRRWRVATPEQVVPA